MAWAFKLPEREAEGGPSLVGLGPSLVGLGSPAPPLGFDATGGGTLPVGSFDYHHATT